MIENPNNNPEFTDIQTEFFNQVGLLEIYNKEILERDLYDDFLAQVNKYWKLWNISLQTSKEPNFTKWTHGITDKIVKNFKKIVTIEERQVIGFKLLALFYFLSNLKEDENGKIVRLGSAGFDLNDESNTYSNIISSRALIASKIRIIFTNHVDKALGKNLLDRIINNDEPDDQVFSSN